MAFDVKDWRNFPDTTTPISATALEDLEERVTQGRIENVLWHGAVGDGVTDDTADPASRCDAIPPEGHVLLYGGRFGRMARVRSWRSSNYRPRRKRAREATVIV